MGTWGVSSCYGFSDECMTKYDDNVYNKFVELFKRLPLATLIENKLSGKQVFVVHGGLYGDFEKYNIEWINENIRKPEDTTAGLFLEDDENDDSKSISVGSEDCFDEKTEEQSKSDLLEMEIEQDKNDEVADIEEIDHKQENKADE